MVQFYPSESKPLTDKAGTVKIPTEVEEELKAYCQDDIDLINGETWTDDDRAELNERNQNLAKEQGRAAAEAEFYKRFEAADANCNDVLSIDEWFEFTEGYKVGREARREKFPEKEDDSLENFWNICDKITPKKEDEEKGVSMAEIEAAFLFCGQWIISQCKGLEPNQ